MLHRVTEGSRQERSPCIPSGSCCCPRAQAALPGAQGAAPKCGTARRAEGMDGPGPRGRCARPGQELTAPHPSGTGQGTAQAPPRHPCQWHHSEAENHTECVVRSLPGWMQETACIEQSWMDTSESYNHKIIKVEKYLKRHQVQLTTTCSPLNHIPSYHTNTILPRMWTPPCP